MITTGRWLGGALVALLVTPPAALQAQGIPVFDVANLQQLITITTRTLTTVEKVREQFELVQKMARSVADLTGYRIPGVETVGHQVDRFAYGRPFLEALNAGDARGGKYYATVLNVRPSAGMSELPSEVQQSIRAAQASIEILDSVAMMGGHQSAIVRGYHDKLRAVVDLLENDLVSKLPGMRELTAVTDKVAAGQLIARRQDMAASQLTSNVLEQMMAANLRKRNAEAANLNMQLNALDDGGQVARSLVQGSESALRNWRQP